MPLRLCSNCWVIRRLRLSYHLAVCNCKSFVLLCFFGKNNNSLLFSQPLYSPRISSFCFADSLSFSRSLFRFLQLFLSPRFLGFGLLLSLFCNSCCFSSWIFFSFRVRFLLEGYRMLLSKSPSPSSCVLGRFLRPDVVGVAGALLPASSRFKRSDSMAGKGSGKLPLPFPVMESCHFLFRPWKRHTLLSETDVSADNHKNFELSEPRPRTLGKDNVRVVLKRGEGLLGLQYKRCGNQGIKEHTEAWLVRASVRALPWSREICTPPVVLL